MALSNKERQKRWLAKNRALHNFRRRKKNLRGDAESTVRTGVPERENDRPTVPDAVGEIPTPATISGFTTKKVGEFRMIVLPEQSKEESTMPVAKPLIFRNDYGVVISESQYNALQEKKRVAKEKGYVLDDYSQ